MKRILLIIPNLDFGGAQRSLIALTEALMPHYELMVCAFNLNAEVSFRFPFPVESLNVRAGKNIPDKALLAFRRINALKKLKRTFDPHISISYLEGSNYLNVLTGKGDKKIISIRGSQNYDETISGIKGKIRKTLLIPRLYPKADKVVALNQGIKRELVEQYGVDEGKVAVIHNYYNLEEIRRLGSSPVPEPFTRIFDRPVFAFTGRLAIEKGVPELIQVFSRVHRTYPECRFVVVGEGPLFSQLIRQADEEGLSVWHPEKKGINPEEAAIIFTGYQENPYAFVSKARALLIASSSEGGPNILAESMILNTLVVSVDCPDGPRERLAPGSGYARQLTKHERAENGWLMPMLKQTDTKRAVQDWVEVLTALLKDPALGQEQVSNASAYMSQFDQSKLAQAWEKIL